MSETINDYYIRFISKKQLDQSSVKNIYHWLRKNLPNGIISSIQVEKGNEGLTPVSLIRKFKNDLHMYEVPLSRKLLKQEFDEINKMFLELSVEGITLEATNIDLASTRHLLTGENKIEPDFYEVMCDMLAQYQHSNWCSEKTAEGWRFGLEFSFDQKTTPLLRPWSDLPSNYKKIDKRLPIEFIKMMNNIGYIFIQKDELAELLEAYETITISQTNGNN